MVCKISPLLNFELLCVFVNCWWQVSCSRLWEFAVPYSNAIILNTKNFFSILFFHLWNLHQILNILEKMMIVIANVFPKLQTVKILVKNLSWKSRFRTFFGSQYVDGCQTHLKCAWEQSYQNFSSVWEEMVCTISPLLKFEILGVFVNTLTAGDKYPVWDRENLQIGIQMHLS